MSRQIINTADAPAAIGTYSQAVSVGNLVFISGQIPLDPVSMEVVDGQFKVQAIRVFENLKAVAAASGGSLADAVKLTVYLSDLSNFPLLNEVMGDYMTEPYPARAAIEVSALPKGVMVEIDAILALND